MLGLGLLAVAQCFSGEWSSQIAHGIETWDQSAMFHQPVCSSEVDHAVHVKPMLTCRPSKCQCFFDDISADCTHGLPQGLGHSPMDARKLEKETQSCLLLVDLDAEPLPLSPPHVRHGRLQAWGSDVVTQRRSAKASALCRSMMHRRCGRVSRAGHDRHVLSVCLVAFGLLAPARSDAAVRATLACSACVRCPTGYVATADSAARWHACRAQATELDELGRGRQGAEHA